MFRPRPRASLEIVAVFEGAVLDVRHLGQREARTTVRTLGIFGGVFLLVGVALFLSQTLGQQSAWTEYQQLAAGAAVAGEQPPGAPVSPWSGLALGLGFLGVLLLAVASVKASYRDASAYTTGEGPDALLATPPVNLLTPDAFELAWVGSTGAAGLRFTADMTGEITVGGRRYTLQEWADRGWALAEDGVFGTTLPVGARCRLEHGSLAFYIVLVEAETASVGRFEVDAPFWAITGATFVGLGSLLILAQLAAPASGQLDLEDHERGRRFVGYVQQPQVHRMPTTPRRTDEAQRALKQSAERPPTPVSPPDAARALSGPPVQKTRPADSAPSILGGRSLSAAGALMARGTGPTERARLESLPSPSPASSTTSTPPSCRRMPTTRRCGRR